MSTNAGLWIDHKNAVIVIVSGSEETTKHVESSVEKHVRFSGGARPGGESREGGGESSRERRFEDQLNHYYDEVIGSIGDAKAILIFGPGEAGGQLRKRLEHARLDGRVVGVERADKMTEPQIAAKVRDYFAG
jgi:hypothetical protein